MKSIVVTFKYGFEVYYKITLHHIIDIFRINKYHNSAKIAKRMLHVINLYENFTYNFGMKTFSKSFVNHILLSF